MVVLSRLYNLSKHSFNFFLFYTHFYYQIDYKYIITIIGRVIKYQKLLIKRFKSL